MGRLYCEAIEVKHILSHAERLPLLMLANLDALAPRLRREQIDEVRKSYGYRLVVERCLKHAYDTPACEVLAECAAKAGRKSPVPPRTLLHLALWYQDIDHDLSQELELWKPLVRGGQVLRRRLRSEWCGG